MQDHELDAWLGDTTATDEQRAALHKAADTIDATYPEQDDRQEAFTGAAMLILGDTTPEQAGQELLAARAAEVAAVRRSVGVAIAAIHAGAAEATTARAVGLDRMTIRKALGK